MQFVLLTSILYGISLLVLHYSFDIFTLKSVGFQVLTFTILFGIGFPFIMERMASKMITKVNDPEMDENENILFEEGVSLFRGALAVGGKLFLTDKRLVFNSHKYNFQNGETSILLRDITEISKRKTMGIVDNGLRVRTKNDSKYDLVVNNRDKWFEQLEKKN